MTPAMILQLVLQVIGKFMQIIYVFQPREIGLPQNQYIIYLL